MSGEKIIGVDVDRQGDTVTLVTVEGKKVLTEHPDGQIEIDPKMGHIDIPADMEGEDVHAKAEDFIDPEDGKRKIRITEIEETESASKA